jgi:HD-like signal output (HDOD) protein
MTVTIVLLALAALLAAGYLLRAGAQRRSDPRVPAAVPASPAETPAAAAPPDGGAAPGSVTAVRSASVQLAERLWRHAFGAAATGGPGAEHAAVGAAVEEALQAVQLDPGYLPRRPALIPQLLRASRDVDAGPASLATIISQDPVLAGDVLRLANSSFYRITPDPVETVQRAIVVCGVDGLQGLIATALMRPIFRASGNNFPRFAPLLWERSARASAAAERVALNLRRQDRFEAQLLALLSALGPLAVYRATLEQYARVPELKPSPALCVRLVSSLGPAMAQRIARDWQSSERLVTALAPGAAEPALPEEHALTLALHGGELLGTLSVLAEENVLTEAESLKIATDSGLPESLVVDISRRLRGGGLRA